MSPKLIALNPDIRRLEADGYHLEIKNGYLVVYDIPYVTSQRTIGYGALVTDLAFNGDQLAAPRDHQVWFKAESFPCKSDGAPIAGLSGSFDVMPYAVWDGFVAQYRFSSKPGAGNYPDYYSKMTTYAGMIGNGAIAIGAKSPRQNKGVVFADEQSVFRYPDTASTRVDIVAATQKLNKGKVAIVGLGGTGSYVLDLIAKTPIPEIHLFDGDKFENHNAFRAPGAASLEDVSGRGSKVGYFAKKYDVLRGNIVPHGVYVTEENIEELVGFSFVFLCVDSGTPRRLISGYLQKHDIPFVDCGMELTMLEDLAEIRGVCRVTLSTPSKHDHFGRRAPMDDEDADNLYLRNIQVADLNALSAALAVGKWKRFCGFYQDRYGAHHITFSVDTESLTRDDEPDDEFAIAPEVEVTN